MAKETAIIIFISEKRNIKVDVETPLDVTANEFVIALNTAYNLNIDLSDIKKCYLKAENPIALLKGNKILSDFGVHNGTIVYYTE